MVPCETFVPRAKGTLDSPDGGVAKAFPPYTAPPTSTSRRATTGFRLMPFPFRTRLRAGNGPRTPSLHLLGCVSTYFVAERVLSAQATPGAVSGWAIGR